LLSVRRSAALLSVVSVAALTVASFPAHAAAGPAATSTTRLCSALDHPALPKRTAGVTGVAGGIYLIGGPALPCNRHRPPEPSLAGTVRVMGASGTVIASQSLVRGQTFVFNLRPGRYSASARLDSGGGPGQSSRFLCRSSGSFHVTTGHETIIPVICPVP
jgi:hypothetical protein